MEAGADILNTQCGSPAGMGQLIKYFESQSRRLDKQKVQTCCLSSDFESSIKFNGVPILPPAMTSSRSEELRQHKKDAVLLEKRLKARQRRIMMAKSDSAIQDQQMMLQDNIRPAARQINFDSDLQDEGLVPGSMRDRLGATNPMSTFATAETGQGVDDFGLQTMDTLNSDFTSMDGESIPTVFSGFKLNSYKEQKISYDLDRLSKILNVNELNSTSGSDISDVLTNTRASEHDIRSDLRKTEKNKAVSADSSCHESQETVVEMSTDNKGLQQKVNVSTSNVFENSQTQELTNNSTNTSPLCGFGNTVDSQRSSRSSPKSLKNAVHFASFVTEYINTSASQSFESTTIVTKKLPSDQYVTTPCSEPSTTDGVLPIIGDPNAQIKKINSFDSSAGMLNRVLLNPDSDSSPCTPPSDLMSRIPFEGYSHIEVCSSDKENEVVSRRHAQHNSSSDQQNTQRRRSDGSSSEAKNSCNEVIIESNDREISHDGRKSQNARISGRLLPSPNIVNSDQRAGGTNQNYQNFTEHDPPVKSSVGDVTKGNLMGSSKTSTITTSESNSNTIKDDLSVKSSTNLAMNIVESVSSQPESVQNKREERQTSPKKLNIDPSEKSPSIEEELPTTPLRRLVRSGSYTLKEPSPALIKARSRLEAEDRKRNSINNSDSGIPVGLSEQFQKHLNELSPESNIAPPNKSGANIHLSQDTEKEGKAEHISKYLSQVQFQNSMSFSHQSFNTNQSQMEEEIVNSQSEDAADLEMNASVIDLVQSLSESGQDVDVLQLTKLHQLRMEQAKQEMIVKQELEMEELFVQQRRETMLLAAEIKAAQELDKEQQDFIIQNAPENIKVKAKGHNEEYSPEHSSNSIKLPPNLDKNSEFEEAVHSLHNLRPSSYHRHSNTDSDQAKSYPFLNRQNVKRKSPIPALNVSADSISNEMHETRLKTVDDSFSPKPDIANFSYSSSSPRMHRPSVFRSPLKFHAASRRDGRVVIPPDANSAQMKPKFDRISAVAKGFLTRCLLRTDKVQELIKTIKDTREFAFDFQTETPIKKGMFSSQDRGLLERIVAQLQAALLDIHEIFFELPICERMALIEQTRVKEMEKRVRLSKDSIRGSGPKMSQATLKALERKRKAKEAENAAMLSISVSRPSTAPTSTSSPRNHHHTDHRALKPLQGHGQSQMSSRIESSRSEKDRPQTAPEKQLTRPKRILASSHHKKSYSPTIEHSKETTKEGGPAVKQSSKLTTKAKIAPSKQNNTRPTKSWR